LIEAELQVMLNHPERTQLLGCTLNISEELGIMQAYGNYFKNDGSQQTQS
jgi:hypothetical protein